MRKAMSVIARTAERLGFEAEEVLELILDFIDYSRGDIRGLREGLSSGNPSVVADHAHSIKGAALNLALDEIGTLASEIEKKGKAKALEGVNELIDAVDKLVEDLARSIETPSES
ncbi:MAG: Hpt domain-containing protein [Pseudomonadota bacterium]